MYGAIIGDLAGSIYEYGQIKQVSPVQIDNVIASLEVAVPTAHTAKANDYRIFLCHNISPFYACK